MSEVNRRGFFGALGALIQKKEGVVRPPYAKKETLFGTVCQECDALCGSACEEEIIKFDPQRLPYLDFSVGGCSNCSACMDACIPNVLEDKSSFIRATLKINSQKCLSWHDTMCFACKEPCLDKAIVFSGLFQPIIIAQNCTACGYCVSLCPTGAIEVRG